MMTRVARDGHVERTWTAPDGTRCILVISQTPPMYTVTLIRHDQVIRERSLYGRASAEMLAEGWCQSSTH
jgi:hypothetical protein